MTEAEGGSELKEGEKLKKEKRKKGKKELFIGAAMTQLLGAAGAEPR